MADKKTTKRIQVRSTQTGLTFDGPIDGLQDLSLFLEEKWFADQSSDLHYGITFYQNLISQAVKTYRITMSKPSYRLTFGDCSPLDHVGNLATGGRFNIGGTQQAVAQKFFNLSMGACIYSASNLACAKFETQFHQGAKKYKLTPKRPLKLINLEKVINSLIRFPNLKQQIDATPTAGLWSSQSVPMVPQLLATHLRNNTDFDGLIYSSTRYSKGKIIAVFIPTGKTGRSLYTTNKIL